MPDKKSEAQRFRDNPEAIASYLADFFEENDHAGLLQAMKKVLRAQNVQAIAREAGLRRDRLYVTFNGEVDPLLYRVMALFEALGVRLTVKALPPREIAERPKLGRPPKKRKADDMIE